MAFRLHVGIDLPNDALGINYKAGSIPVHRSLVLALSRAHGIQQPRFGIGEEIDGETEFVAEVFM